MQIATGGLLIAIGFGLAAAEVRAQGAEAGPGAIPPEETIFARRVLMSGIDVYMQEIEAFVADARANGTDIPFEAAEAADIVSTMLIGIPHLFPPGSDTWSAAAEAEDPTKVTLALPALWENFDDFYDRATAASQQAFDLSRMRPRDAAWVQAAGELRESCTSCHADYTRFKPLEDIEPPLPVTD